MREDTLLSYWFHRFHGFHGFHRFARSSTPVQGSRFENCGAVSPDLPKLAEIGTTDDGAPFALRHRMAGWKHFSEIVAWQLANQLKRSVYALIERPQFRAEYKLCDQLREAARSGPSNIAEGFGRFGNKEFARFVRIAKGSEIEVMNHLADAHDRKLITVLELDSFDHLARRAVRAAVGLIHHLETTPQPPPPKAKLLKEDEATGDE